MIDVLKVWKRWIKSWYQMNRLRWWLYDSHPKQIPRIWGYHRRSFHRLLPTSEKTNREERKRDKRETSRALLDDELIPDSDNKISSPDSFYRGVVGRSGFLGIYVGSRISTFLG